MRKLIILLLILTLIVIACRSKTKQNKIAAPPTSKVALTRQEVVSSGATATPAPTVGGAAVAPPTGTPTPGPTATPIPSPTPRTPPMPIPTPVSPLVEHYTVQAGDTLGGISLAYDIPLDDLIALNGLESNSAIIQVGQTLHVPLDVSRSGPLVTLLPDSEVVYSPAYVDFDTAAFIRAQDGYLADYSERVSGVELNAAEIVDRIARQFSVGPRVLLALLEYYGGWVSNPQPTGIHPLGPACPYGDSLFWQLGWTANRVNEGYYGYKRSGSIAVRFRNRNRAVIPPQMNAGTVGIQNVLAVNSNWETWLTEVEPDGPFMQTYQRLFGDPFAQAVEPLVPIDLTQPPLSFPWEAGNTFYYTGGPHAAYGDGSAWAALDFGPPDVLGSCYYSEENLAAAADGQIFLGSKGESYLDLDADGHLQTGWVLLYLHMVARDDLSPGQKVSVGTPLGYASCEGGVSDASHLHFARRYNGEWMAASGPVPMVLSGWKAKAGLGQYEGALVRGAEVKEACECWDKEMNALTIK